jgi:enoyl-CoA hydratase/carnithine racemase
MAEIDGRAIAGGNELPLNMDMRFAGPKARFGIPQVGGGVIHGGGLQRLVQVTGAPQAM